MPKFETDAELAFVKTGKAYLCNDALRMFTDSPRVFAAEAKVVDPNRKPKGFSAFWDNMCKSLGWQALRTASASTGLLKSRNSITEKLKPIVKRMPLTNRQF